MVTTTQSKENYPFFFSGVGLGFDVPEEPLDDPPLRLPVPPPAGGGGGVPWPDVPWPPVPDEDPLPVPLVEEGPPEDELDPVCDPVTLEDDF